MTEPKPDNKAAADFLTRWAPEGPWVLMAIRPDKKSFNTTTLRPGQEADLERWLSEYNGNHNIYFHVNPVLRDLTKKAQREHIKELAWLHVDIDPRAGEDLEEEQARALSLLTDRLPKGVPPPSVVIFSGGGYQGFWRLEEPLPVEGDLARAEDVKLYNMQLELMFGADNCHNIDRIMRLPGTINIPDVKKRKKGRVEALASVVIFEDTAYSINEFAKAAPLQTGATDIGGGSVPVDINGAVDRIGDVAELDQWDVPDRVKIIMAQGHHPDEPKEGDNSRSAWLYDFCCQMVRLGVPDEVTFSIITDPEWPISESVVEHKTNAEKYALRQIQRAKEAAIDPWLAYFNQHYFVVKKVGGKCMVLSEALDHALDRPLLVKQTLPSFEQGYENKRVKVGEDKAGNPKTMAAGKWWRYHTNRQQYERLTFMPDREAPEGHYNLWRGFAVESIPGDCSLFLDHILTNICNGSVVQSEYLLSWMARAVQEPSEVAEVAVVLRGGRGTGKSLFAKVFGSLFGRHFMQVSNSSHLVGNFNAHLRDLVVLFADEAFYAADKKHESILKTLVTESTMPYEAKGVDVETGPNYIHLIMASNDRHVVPAGCDERRFFVLDVGDRHQKDTTYFKAMLDQLDNGGREALLHMLRTRDLSDFQVRDVPDTEALQEQKLLSLEPDDEWWYQRLLQGQLLQRRDGWPEAVIARELLEDFQEHSRRGHFSRKSSETKLGIYLKEAMRPLHKFMRNAKIEVTVGDGFVVERNQRCLHYRVPSLATCRRLWEERHGRTEWPDNDGDQESLPEATTSDPF